MKRLFFILIIIIAIFSVQAQVTQVGVVRELNSDGKTLSGVGITIPTASDVQPAFSDNNGIFLLKFSRKQAGDVLYNIRVFKPDYEVVNLQLLKDGWTLTEKDTLEIILAQTQVIAESRAKYYHIIDQYQIRQYNETIVRLKKELEKQMITSAEYSQRADEAEMELRDAYEQLDDYAERLARINKDDMDSLSRAAFQRLENGDIKGAIEVYESQDLLQQLKDKVALRDESMESIRLLMPKLKEEAQFRQMAAGKENIQRADTILAQIVHADTTDFGNISNYVEFLIQQQDFDKALQWNRFIINHEAASDYFAIAFQRQGHVLYKQSQFEEAEKYLLQCLQLDFNSKKQDSIQYLNDISYTMNTLGNLYLDIEDFEKAEKYLKEALSIRKQLSEEDSSFTANYATSLNNIGELYRTTEQFQEAVNHYQEAIAIRKKLVLQKPSEFSYPLANSLNNLGHTYASLEDFENAKSSYTQAESILNQLYDSNPEYYGGIYVILLNNIGHLYQQFKHYDLVADYYNKAITLCRQRSPNNPETYRYYESHILNNLGSYYKKMEQWEKAKDYYEESLKIRQDLVQFSDAYQTLVALSLQNLAKVYAVLEQTTEAEQSFLQSNLIYKKSAKIKPTVYQKNYISSCQAIGDFYASQNDKKSAKKYYSESIKTYQLMEKRDAGDFSEEIKSVKEQIKAL